MFENIPLVTKLTNMANKKMSFNATWSMAVGGMVGGGIFSVLGVVVQTAGQWAWLSFILSGLIALVSAHSYSQLSIAYKGGGGAFMFLRKVDQKNIAGGLSWILILGYTLTISVYAFTFGNYVAHVFSAGAWLPRVLAFAVIAVLSWVNLLGVGESASVEIITVWGKLFVLLGLALIGLIAWNPAGLTQGIEPKSWHYALVGAATLFMAYEGFQLLSYDYDAINNPAKTLPRATISAVLAVIVVYVLVTYGATMLVGAKALIDKQEVALSIAGKKALGTTGLILVTIAAAFSTGSAVNATLFSTGKLMGGVAKHRDLPDKLSEVNKSSMPAYAIISIAAVAAVLAVIGSLGELVHAASLIFLLTFGVVNYLAFRKNISYKWFSLAGAVASVLAIGVSIWQQIHENPVPLSIMVGLIILTFVGRPYLIKIIYKK